MNTPDWLQNIKPGPSFSDEMVRAVMRGDKTQTRRMIQDPPTQPFTLTKVRGRGVGIEERLPDGGSKISQYAPYQPGEIYYLREGIEKCCYHAAYTATGDAVKADTDIGVMMWEKSSGEPYKVDKLPGIYMPRRAARTFLRITDVWVERVQDIGREGVIAEGAVTEQELVSKMPVCLNPATPREELERLLDLIAREEYWQPLWCDINGQDSWKANPLVWVLGFETVTREEAKGENDE